MTEMVLLGGTDGHRGEFTEDQTPGLINETTFRDATFAFGTYLLEQGAEPGPFVVARDTRPSSPALSRAVIEGATALGVDVMDLGVAPTPMAQRVAGEIGALATVAVTASHNEAGDNGWKGMIGNRKPNKDEVRAFSEIFWSQTERGLMVPRGQGIITQEGEYRRELYRNGIVKDIREQFGDEKPLEGKIIVVDGANGAAKNITPDVLRDLGATVEEFSCGEGVINEKCGAADPDMSGLREYLNARPELLRDPNFLGAVANDGDADRMMGMGVIHPNGKLALVEINGNHVMEALAQGEPGIVGTQYTNTGMVRRLQRADVGFEYCDNGDMHVTKALQAKQAAGLGWRRGGEFTGHQVDLDWLPSGDGVRMAAWFAAWAAKRGQTFGEIYEQLPLWAEEMRKVRIPAARATEIMRSDEVRGVVAQAEKDLGANGRIIVRKSGTESNQDTHLQRVWGEAANPGIDRVIAGIAAAIMQRATA